MRQENEQKDDDFFNCNHIVFNAVTLLLKLKLRFWILNYTILILAPRIPAEIERTAAVKGMLEGELKSAESQIISVQLDSQQYVNSGVGYLFDHDDVAADLAKKWARITF